MRAITLGALLIGALVVHSSSAQEQKIVYLDGVSSTALDGDPHASVKRDGKAVRDQAVLPRLLKNGWRVESVHPTSNGKAFVVLIAPVKGRQ